MPPNNPVETGTQPIPVIMVRQREAMDTWEAHKELLMIEKRKPWLRHNPQWLILRADAYEAFYSAFEVVA